MESSGCLLKTTARKALFPASQARGRAADSHPALPHVCPASSGCFRPLREGVCLYRELFGPQC